MTTPPSLFDAGHVIRTPGALLEMVLAHVSACSLLQRHQRGDFGDVTEADRASNLRAIADGGRVLSSYAISRDVCIWVITDGDRLLTTLLLPSEYASRFPDLAALPSVR